jgi:adenosine deaminase
MSGTTLSREFALVADQFDLRLDDCRRLSLNAARSAFAPWELKRSLAERIAAF